MAEIFWHNLEIEEVARLLRTDIKNGLSEREVEVRQREFGKNELPEEKPLSGLRIFLEQFRSPLIYILVIAGIITLILRDFTDAIVIFGAVFLNTIIGFIQENKTSKILAELKKVVKVKTYVIRERKQKEVEQRELVPGDIILLYPGNKVPADGRLIEAHDLKINEMVLTGEWLPAKKKSGILAKEVSLADRDNMVYLGTIVEDGRGKAVVTETGLKTEIGKIAAQIKETKEEKTPYQKKVIHLSRIIGITIVFISFLIFIFGIAFGREAFEMFLTAVAVAVAAIPEGLPVAVTVILALGMQRILKRQGLVRKMVKAETLGSTSVIATDKTCTLTEGKMKVAEVIGDKFLTLKAAVLTSEAFIENPEQPKEKWIIRGRPTDRALLEAGIEMEIDKKKEFAKKKIAEIPFNSINKFAVALYEEEGRKILYVCGAPEKILELSKLTVERKKEWQEKLEELAKRGLRVVASAYKIANVHEFPTNNIREISGKLVNIRDLNFLGLITLKDPLRKETFEAMKICRQAGMKPIIVTGDHKLTAKAVAEELGFKIKEENILEGKDLDKLSDEEFEKVLDKIQIYARVEPRHKMRIISAWQERGEVVAMTGDGINDAPALKKADIGLALGSGTDVAKEASDLVLLTDNFNIIAAAVEEGRAIIDNIRKVITYLLSSSLAEVILIGFSIILGWPLPVLAVQILWINLIEDGPLGIALAFEPKEKDLMKRPPEFISSNGKRRMVSGLLTQEMKAIIFIIGIILNILLVGLFWWLLEFSGYTISHIRTIIFVGLAIDSLFFVFACKSLRHNLWQFNIFSNKFLILSWGLGIITLIAAIYLPIFQALLKTVPLNFVDWLLLLGLGTVSLILIELTKWYFITRKSKIE